MNRRRRSEPQGALVPGYGRPVVAVPRQQVAFHQQGPQVARVMREDPIKRRVGGLAVVEDVACAGKEERNARGVLTGGDHPLEYRASGRQVATAQRLETGLLLCIQLSVRFLHMPDHNGR